jgi:hypothetical protein
MLFFAESSPSPSPVGFSPPGNLTRLPSTCATFGAVLCPSAVNRVRLSASASYSSLCSFTMSFSVLYGLWWACCRGRKFALASTRVRLRAGDRVDKGERVGGGGHHRMWT